MRGVSPPWTAVTGPGFGAGRDTRTRESPVRLREGAHGKEVVRSRAGSGGRAARPGGGGPVHIKAHDILPRRESVVTPYTIHWDVIWYGHMPDAIRWSVKVVHYKI